MQWEGDGAEYPSLLLRPLLISSFQAADSRALGGLSCHSGSIGDKLCDLGQVTLPLSASISSS